MAVLKRRDHRQMVLIPVLTFLLSYLLLLFFPVRPGRRTVAPPRNLAHVQAGNFAAGEWKFDQSRHALYDQECPFHRKNWNCLNNGRPGMDRMYGWSWVVKDGNVPVIDPASFLDRMRNRNIGLVGDSLNENLLVALLCILGTADSTARRWKRRGAWRGAFFPSYNVTVGYHRAVLLAHYTKWQSDSSQPVLERDVVKGFRVDVDVPARDWINVTTFYDVLIFNTGHWWGVDKFPEETPLVFFQQGHPVLPPLNTTAGLELVVRSMVAYVEQAVPGRTLKLWRTQTPRHFHGGDWNQNGSCRFDELLSADEVELWFRPENGGVNKEEREVNKIIRTVLEGTSFRVLDVAPMSEFRADAHPALWLSGKDSHLTWGQDCLHWCVPGIPDIWVDFVAATVLLHLPLQGQS